MGHDVRMLLAVFFSCPGTIGMVANSPVSPELIRAVVAVAAAAMAQEPVAAAAIRQPASTCRSAAAVARLVFRRCSCLPL
jgi:hypothetical protein